MLVEGTQSGAFIFGLEHVPLPAVACDDAGRVIWANKRFHKAVGGAAGIIGRSLSELAPLAEPGARWPEWETLGAGSVELPKVLLDGVPYAVHAGPSETLTGCVFTPLAPLAALDSRTPGQPQDSARRLVPPTGTKLLLAFIQLSRELNLTMREEELLLLFVKTFESLFPGRLVCVRLVDPETLALKQIYANSRLRKEKRQAVELLHSACLEHGLLGEMSPIVGKPGISIIESFEPVFEHAVAGFDVPIFDGTAFYGALRFEYLTALAPLKEDQALVLPLAQLMSAAIRNARLLTETVHLKDYLEKLVDRANAPMVVVDRQRRVTVINQAFEQQTGTRRQTVLGVDLMTLIPQADHARLLPAVAAAMRGEPLSNIEVRVPLPGVQTYAHIAFNTAAITNAFGELESVIFVGQNLTEIRALQNQIIHSEKLAVLGQVAAGVAHELNNPLTSISVYADYLAKKLAGVLDEKDRLKFARILEAAARIQEFTRDLVAYARPDSEEPTMLGIGELVSRAGSFLEHLIAASKATVHVEIEAGLLPVYGIRGQLEQVFVNLITNACQALPETGGRITIGARLLEDKERIEIFVADTGGGIPEKLRVTVFEPFFTTKPEGKGTGLGLSIVRNILDNHNAMVRVESQVGQGTTFFITMYAG